MDPPDSLARGVAQSPLRAAPPRRPLPPRPTSISAARQGELLRLKRHGYAPKRNEDAARPKPKRNEAGDPRTSVPAPAPPNTHSAR